MNVSSDELDTLQQKDAAHHIHPFSDMRSLNATGTRIIDHAEGVYVYEQNGHQLLDCMSGLWCVNMGYSRQDICDAVSDQMKRLPFYNSFFQCTHAPAIELATELCKIAPDHLNHVFFTGSGSECNDTVLRFSRRYWALRGQPDKDVIISRKNAYHGSTVAGASLGGMAPMHEQGSLPIPGIVHIDQPYWFGEGGDEDQNEFGLRISRQLEEKILELGVDKVAAFIGEPIQGAGGVIIPPDSYWPEIQRICDQYGILLIADEVITGYGRTGNWFASETYGIKPDFICSAKGLSSGYLPIGAVYVSDRVADLLIDECGEIAHGFTYSGHPACCAAALANIKAMHDENIIERIQNDIAPYLQKRWRELADHPIVGEVRGIGMIGALELVADKNSRARFSDEVNAGLICRNNCVKNGLIMRSCGETMVISPPFIITHEQVDELIAKARQSLDDTLADIKNSQ